MRIIIDVMPHLINGKMLVDAALREGSPPPAVPVVVVPQGADPLTPYCDGACSTGTEADRTAAQVTVIGTDGVTRSLCTECAGGGLGAS